MLYFGHLPMHLTLLSHVGDSISLSSSFFSAKRLYRNEFQRITNHYYHGATTPWLILVRHRFVCVCISVCVEPSWTYAHNRETNTKKTVGIFWCVSKNQQQHPRKMRTRMKLKAKPKPNKRTQETYSPFILLNVNMIRCRKWRVPFIMDVECVYINFMDCIQDEMTVRS